MLTKRTTATLRSKVEARGLTEWNVGSDASDIINMSCPENITFKDIKDTIDILYESTDRNHEDKFVDKISITAFSYLLIKPKIIRSILSFRLPYTELLNEKEAKIINDLYMTYGHHKDLTNLLCFYHLDLTRFMETTENDNVELAFGANINESRIEKEIQILYETEYRNDKWRMPPLSKDRIWLHFPSEYDYLNLYSGGIIFEAFEKKYKLMRVNMDDEQTIELIYANGKTIGGSIRISAISFTRDNDPIIEIGDRGYQSLSCHFREARFSILVEKFD